MTKSKAQNTKGKKVFLTKVEIFVIVGLVIVAAIGMYATPSKAADLLYAPKVPQAAYNDTGWYIAGRVSANDVQDFKGIPFETGYGFSGAVGHNFGQIGFLNLRGEAEVGHLTSGLDVGAPVDGSLDATYAFLNAYVDIGDIWGFTPYVGGGVGYADVNGKAQWNGFPIVDSNDQGFAWNVGGGVSYALTDNVAFDVGYRYITVNDIDLPSVFGTISDDVNIHEINAGVRVSL